jgi:hypothetical protein
VAAREEEEERRSEASRRQRRQQRQGDGAGARDPRGAAGLRGAGSTVRSAAASLSGASGREDAEQVDERQQQEPGARIQLHSAAAGRQRVHLHHPGQRRAALPAGPPPLTSSRPSRPTSASWGSPQSRALSIPDCGGPHGCRAP